jgi:hypothetical protein
MIPGLKTRSGGKALKGMLVNTRNTMKSGSRGRRFLYRVRIGPVGILPPG